MKIVVESNCLNNQNDTSLIPLLRPILEKLVHDAGLDTLDYFVIADSDDAKYCNSVKKYASTIGTEACVTQDGKYSAAGKTLNSVDEASRLHQAIIIKSDIWEIAAIECAKQLNLLPKGAKVETPKNIGAISLIFHEFGHAIDDRNQFKIWGTINEKIQYDLTHEYDEYINQTALSLWGEYFAESFAWKHNFTGRHSTIGSEKNLIDCIKTYSLGIQNSYILERVYRILYYSMLRLASLHQQANINDGDGFDALQQNPVAVEYTPLFLRVERVIKELNRDYPEWDSYARLNDFSQLIKDFLCFERKRQWRIKMLGR